jgi:hypothetical protein
MGDGGRQITQSGQRKFDPTEVLEPRNIDMNHPDLVSSRKKLEAREALLRAREQQKEEILRAMREHDGEKKMRAILAGSQPGIAVSPELEAAQLDLQKWWR